ncbi:hypothetical protein SLUN_30100 [Streptomyces lunaelactis]|uniref:Uncharacterized protein n=1 Tax=Streptomyces lunaelactis TaxID=1535768 RepID=A0A2R4T9M9_9ACTN|nr:hypothetical protein [Streptomyces lunaelactis]AVZ75825.1 hypothetical protein SLUN_30100 [Streptomyces lunaelactis]NUK84680.1 hypothetical protein [Streptomyces lunaelactis]NUL01827.1 hypothetical protein [Streptomyces lunaelactis]
MQPAASWPSEAVAAGQTGHDKLGHVPGHDKPHNRVEANAIFGEPSEAAATASLNVATALSIAAEWNA